MVRVLPLILMLLMCVSVPLVASMPASAQSIFIKRGENTKKNEAQSEKKSVLPGFIVRPGGVNDARQQRRLTEQNRERQRNYERAAQQLRRQQQIAGKVRSFEAFEKARNLDMSLLAAGARDPRSQEELAQIGAVHNMPKVATMLENRRLMREERQRKKNAAATSFSRSDYLRSVATQNEQQRQPAPAAVQNAAPSSGEKTRGPSRIFNIFR
jgi:hypothetical protein